MLYQNLMLMVRKIKEEKRKALYYSLLIFQLKKLNEYKIKIKIKKGLCPLTLTYF